MSAAPFLTTGRLELWQPQRDDLPGHYAVTADPDVRRFLGPEPPSEKASAHHLLRSAGSWALYGYGTLMIRRTGEAAIIGHCGVFHSWRGFGKGMDDVPEAGWILARDHWGKGYASEAMRAILDWFDRVHAVTRVSCMIEEGHTASIRLAEKLGFVPYGRHGPEEGTPLVLFERSGP